MPSRGARIGLSLDRASAARDERGVVYIEALVAFMPVFLFFFGLLQLADVIASQLLVRRAAAASVRAAVVVLPDDGRFYDDPGNALIHRFEGLRRADIERAAALVLSTSSRLRPVEEDGHPAPTVRVTGEFSGRNPITAEVTALHRCFGGVLGYACGSDRAIALTARASLPYQDADYEY